MQNGSTDLFGGCGAFWVANSIMSTVLGGKNRELQQEAAKQNEAFQLELERARNIAQDEMEAEKIAFRRRMMSLSREWQRDERAKSFVNMNQAIQLNAYASQWPLGLMPSTILSQIKQGYQDSLNVILLHTPVLAGENGLMTRRGTNVRSAEIATYKSLEEYIKNDMSYVGNVNFRKDAWLKADQSNIDSFSSSADIMNIHYLMGSVPTLVFLPKYQDNAIFITAAMWDEQTERPLYRPLFALPHNPIHAMEDEKYRKEVIEKLHYTLSITTGVIRDQYAMLTWGKQPTLHLMLDAEGNERMKQFAIQNKSIRGFLLQENDNLKKALDASNSPQLLQLYEKSDLNYMIRILDNQDKMLNA